MAALASLRSAFTAMTVAAAACASPVAAQSLLVNGTFEEVLGLTYWTVELDDASWSGVQCPGFGAIGSGSALLAYSGQPGNPPARISQCVPANPGSRYRLAGSIYIPESTVGAQAGYTLRAVAGTCESWTSVYWGTGYAYEAPDCRDIDLTILAPLGSDALVVELELNRLTSDTNAYAYFDDIKLFELPEPAALTGLRRRRSATRAARAAATRARTRSSPPTPRAG